MPSVIATIEDFSPLLAYSLDWAQGSSSSDQQVSRYSASSFFATSKTGGTFSFSFTGTGIELFGSKRNNHGGYQVTLDGTSFPSQSGQAADPGTFQTSLFSRNNLNEGIHNITLTNQGTNNQFVDIDFVTFRTSVGRDDEPLIMNTIQDNDPAFVYSPASAWSTTPDNLGTFSGGSGHFASDGTMTFTFEVSSLTDTGISSTDILLQGDAVALYGPVGPSAASYGVQVDGGTTSTFSANKASFVPQVLLYHGSNLGPGKHSLKFVCRPSSGQVCSIDYAEVYTTPSIQGSSGSSAGSVSGGAVAGIVIGVLLFAGLLLFGLFLYLRRRKHQRRKDSQELLVNAAGLDAPASFPDPIPNNYAYTQGTTLAYPAPSQPIPPSTYNSSGQLQYSYSANGSDPSSTITYPASLHRADTADTIARQKSPSVVTTDASAPVIYPYSPSSDLESRSSSSRSGSQGSQGSQRAMIRTIANSTSPRPRIISMKGQVQLSLPSAAGQSLSSVPENELRTNRLVVEGRPQDFGSLSERDDVGGSGSGNGSGSGGGSGGDDSQYMESQPPPDYSQATEPYGRQR